MAEQFDGMGYANTAVLKGGVNAWKVAGYP
ncbi:Rhodanese-related sulfurtransferase [Trichlorobacter ammonificans]|uniref:Rhodanese-related sulfurtransferase n=1 Tax=Trichlorobacter ammonificans TaxID=2916410 RepID=A0ABN8HIH5_9BACT|nr:Rhodanese-related sulfurtransferase [Trichlorobacter ammonificans]